MIKTKICSKCLLDLPLIENFSRRRSNTGYIATCKNCIREYSRLKSASGRTKESERIKKLKHRFNITPEDYETMFSQQNYSCAICKEPWLQGQNNFHIDHDHKCCPTDRSCGKCIRGILCPACNKALGLVKESKETLQKLIDYLDDSTKNVLH